MADNNYTDKEYQQALKKLREKNMNLSDTNVNKALTGNLDSGSELSGTLAEETDEELLPVEEMDDLDILETAMQQVSEKAAEKGIGKGMEAVTGSLEEGGMNMEEMSGDITSKIINFTQQQVTSPIQSEFQTMSNLVNGIRNQRQKEQQAARQNLTTAINTGAVANMDDEQLEKMSNTIPGMDLPTLQTIRTSVEANNAAEDSIRDSIAEDVDEMSDEISKSMKPEQAKQRYKESLIARYGEEYSDYIDSQISGRLTTTGSFEDNMAKVEEFINENINASREEIEAGLNWLNEKKDLGFNQKALSDKVSEVLGKEREGDMFLTDAQLSSMADNLVQKYGSVKKARDAVEFGKIETTITRGKGTKQEKTELEEIELSTDQIQTMKRKIDEKYPEGYEGTQKQEEQQGSFWGEGLREMAD